MAWPLAFRKVEGHSMAPHLMHGRIVVVTRWFARPQVGDVVVVRHDGLEKIKRVTQIERGRIFASGDNRLRHSESHDLGWLEHDAIIAKLLWPRV